MNTVYPGRFFTRLLFVSIHMASGLTADILLLSIGLESEISGTTL
jgi:hypothetical protein